MSAANLVIALPTGNLNFFAGSFWKHNFCDINLLFIYLYIEVSSCNVLNQ